jgi:hypothetical protein
MKFPDDSKPTHKATTASDFTGAAWLSVAQAARALGLTSRAVQKRAALGKIGARKIGDGADARWEIEAASVATSEREPDANQTANFGANREPKNANCEPEKRERFAVWGAFESEKGCEPRTDEREPNANFSANRELGGERESELKDEIRFLRGLVESLTQSEAQTKAALREALKAMPKQLNAAPFDAPQSAQRDDPTTPEKTRSTLGRQSTNGAAFTYDGIADALERDLNARGL